MPIELKTQEDIQTYVRNTMAKIKHHAAYAEEIFDKIVVAVLMYADKGSLTQYGGDTNKGAVISFSYHEHKFRMKADHTARQLLLVHNGQIVESFKPTDNVKEKLNKALKGIAKWKSNCSK